VFLKGNKFLKLARLCGFPQTGLARQSRAWDLGGSGNLVNVLGIQEPELQSSLLARLLGSQQSSRLRV